LKKNSSSLTSPLSSHCRGDAVLKTKFTAVLLAGGKSTRMGRDKALLPVKWQGTRQPLWKRQLSVLEELQPAEIFLSGVSREDCPKSVAVLSDEVAGAGPLSGILTCLRAASCDRVLVLAVDLGRMTSPYLAELLAASQPECGVVPIRDGRYEPLAAVYPKIAYKIAQHQLEQGARTLQEFISALVESALLRPQKIRPDELRLFENWNSPEDYAAAGYSLPEAL
jgi:molybdenum cofactor guanylyltransferase